MIQTLGTETSRMNITEQIRSVSREVYFVIITHTDRCCDITRRAKNFWNENFDTSLLYCIMAEIWEIGWFLPWWSKKVSEFSFLKIFARREANKISNHYTRRQKKRLVWVNFFRQKVFLWSKTNFHLVGQAEKIAFPPLNYDQKVEFWPFLACCVQHCSNSRASALVQLASLESSDSFYAGGSTWKSLWGPGGTIQEHLL